MSPIAYLLISLAFTSALLSVVFLMAWASFGRRSYVLAWSGAFLVAAIQYVLNLPPVWHAILPNEASYWLAVNATSFLAVSLAFLGHRQRVGLRTRVPWLVGVALAGEAVIAWFTVVHPHYGIRTALGPAYTAVLMLWIARILVRHRPRPLLAEWGAAVVTAVFGLDQAAAATITLLQGAAGDDARLGALYSQVNFLGMPAAYTGMGLFVVFILASDLAHQMESLAMTDPLTGIANRRGFEAAARRALARARRTRDAVSLVLADIDHFKKINDTWGHDIGDEALRVFGRHLTKDLRAGDLVGRIGGEEFALTLPGVTQEGARKIAERLRVELAGVDVPIATRTLVMTASFGVAAADPDGEALEELIRRADAALYSAKEAGRNQVMVAASPAPGTSSAPAGEPQP